MRAVQRYAPRALDDEGPLAARIVELAGTYGRHGYRRITALLRGEAWRENHKRVERVWREAGLKGPRKQPSRGQLWLGDGSCGRLRPTHRDHVWAYDFVSARTHDGLPLRMLVAVDEFTRECLSIDVGLRLTSDDVLERLSWLTSTRAFRSRPAATTGSSSRRQRSVSGWRRSAWGRTSSSPRSPSENGYVESLNGRPRDGELLYSVREAKVVVESWRKHDITDRPHSAPRHSPPAPEADAPVPIGAMPDPSSAALKSGLAWGPVRRTLSLGVG